MKVLTNHSNIGLKIITMIRNGRSLSMKRKYLGLLLLTLILLISACGKGEANQGSEKVKLIVWVWDSAKTGFDVNMEEFKKKHPHIDIEFQINGTDDVFNKFLVSSASGDEVPDVIAVQSSQLAKLVDVGSLLDISERVASYEDKMNSFKWADASKDGKIYAMPWDSGPVVMFYRNDIFAQAGLPSEPAEVEQHIQTFADYYEAAKQIKEKTGVSMFSDSKTASNNRFFETIMWQRGLWYFDKNGKVTLDTPEVIEIGEYIADFMNEELVYDAEPWGDAWLNGLLDDKVATIVGASWFDGVLSGWVAPEAVGKWSVVKMPKWALTDQYGSANDGGSNLAINKHSHYPDEAWEFIEFMLGNEDAQLKMTVDAGLFTALEPVYSHSDFQHANEYFGGQNINSIFAEAVKDIYPQAYTADFPAANQIMTDAFAKIFLKGTSVQQAFKEAADDIREQMSR